MPTPQTLHLLKMANQIAANFAHEEEPEQVRLVAAHLRRFWAPEMRRKLCAQLEEPEVRGALAGSARAALLSLES